LNLDEICRVPILPGPGMTVMADSVSLACGGKGLNQAVAASRSAPVVMIGAVGEDEAGGLLIDCLVQAGVDVSSVARLADHPTGRARISVSPSGENQIVVTTGANGAVDAREIASKIPKGTRVVLAQLETPTAAIEAAFSTEAAQAARKILNAAPAIASAAALFPLADMIIFNQSELATYLQLDREPQSLEALLPVRRFLTRPNQAAVVTLGALGAAAIWADRTLVVEGFAVEPVDTTGAGDCLCGVIAAAVANGIGPERALTLANAAAALSTLTPGAAQSTPQWDEVEAFVTASGR
jgi:ribokinase